MICWYCYWGWPKPVSEIYRRAAKDLVGSLDPLHFGPAHVVWDDENFDLAQVCIDHFDEYKGNYGDKELAIVRRSLEELAALPLSVVDIEPTDYDGEHPENYPPTCEMEFCVGCGSHLGGI